MLIGKYALVGTALWMICPAAGLLAQNTFPATGNAGVGTTAPTYPLQVVGNIKAGGTAGAATGVTIGNHGVELGAIEFNQSDNSRRFWLQTNGINTTTERLSLYGGPLNQSATQEMMSFSGRGNVGIGTVAPRNGLEVAAQDSSTLTTLRIGGVNSGTLTVPLGAETDRNQIVFSGWRDSQNNTTGAKIAAINRNAYQANYAGWQSTDLVFFTLNSAPNSADNTTESMRLTAGNLGIGTSTPAAKLEVNGSVKLTTGSGASVTYQDGSVQTVAWNGVLGGGDYAESVDVTGDRAQYEPGDVLVIDPAAEGKFLKSATPYETSVMGIYSTKPGVVGRRQASDKSHMKDEVPMAMVGVVPTKVSAEGGPIRPGDLLVTSSTPGYAMKGTDRSQLTGAIIGKALGHLDAGTGTIEVAVSLQ